MSSLAPPTQTLLSSRFSGFLPFFFSLCSFMFSSLRRAMKPNQSAKRLWMEERWLSKRKKRSDSLKILMDDTLTLKEGSLNSIDEVKEMFPSCLKECELVRYVLSG